MKRYFLLLAGFFIVLLLISAGTLICLGVWHWYSTLSAPAAQSIMGLAGGGVGFALTKSWERKRDLERDQRAKKIPVYEDILRFVFRVMSNERTADQDRLSDVQMVNEMAKLNPQLIIWASDEVLSEYSKWRKAILPSLGEPAVRQTLVQFAKLLLAIRKDVGQKNKELNPVDVLRIFVNDIDTSLES